jgi:predicted PolB exonuclease-like 3'-5' exonuclease
MVADGYTLLTWNGLGFDLDVLAEEADAHQQCRTLALNHVDMMFHVFCDRGFPVALDKAAHGLGIPGKQAGMSGVLAPQLWAQGRYQEVIDYVSQDVRIALQIAVMCEGRRRFDWITRRGTTSSMELPRGWLSVQDALRLPEPDTSWMNNPIPRKDFIRWLDLR